MKIYLSKIPKNGLEVNEDLVLEKRIYQNSSLLDIKKLHIEGLIFYDYEGILTLDLESTGIFLVQDSLTLEEIEYPFKAKIDVKISDIEAYCGEFYEKSKNALDISEILWENIVLEIPISFTTHKSEELQLKGNGWELMNEKKEEIDPRLAKLKELLDDRKE